MRLAHLCRLRSHEVLILYRERFTPVCARVLNTHHGRGKATGKDTARPVSEAPGAGKLCLQIIAMAMGRGPLNSDQVRVAWF